MLRMCCALAHVRRQPTPDFLKGKFCNNCSYSLKTNLPALATLSGKQYPMDLIFPVFPSILPVYSIILFYFIVLKYNIAYIHSMNFPGSYPLRPYLVFYNN